MTYQQKFQQDMQRSAGRFEDLVSTNRVMMFSSTNCDYCDVAKKTFDSLGTSYNTLEINKLGLEGSLMRNTLKAVTGSRSVPSIFICGEAVKGGSSGLTDLVSSGQLEGMLTKCCQGDLTCSNRRHR